MDNVGNGDKKITIGRFVQKVHSFPALPTVVSRIMQITASSDASLPELQKLIEADSSLAVEILRWANSPLFGFRREVTTLQHAITLMGMREVKNLILAKTMFQTFQAPGEFDSFALWRHSYYAGMAARIIAKLSQGDIDVDANECFTAGLIHDIGKLVIYLELDEESIKKLEYNRPLNPNIIEEEESMMGIGHDHLGMQLLKKWTFPPKLQTAVGFHHHPENAPEEKHFSLIIHIADLISHLYEVETLQIEQAAANKTELEKMLLRPAVCELAKEQGIPLNTTMIEIFLGNLKMEIQQDTDVISLLTGRPAARIS